MITFTMSRVADSAIPNPQLEQTAAYNQVWRLQKGLRPKTVDFHHGAFHASPVETVGSMLDLFEDGLVIVRVYTLDDLLAEKHEQRAAHTDCEIAVQFLLPEHEPIRGRLFSLMGFVPMSG